MEAQGDLKFQQHQRSKLFDKDISIQTAEEKARIKQQYGGGTTTTTKVGKGGGGNNSPELTPAQVAQLKADEARKELEKLKSANIPGTATKTSPQFGGK